MTPTAPRRGALATLAAVAVLGPLTVAVPGVADAVDDRAGPDRRGSP